MSDTITLPTGSRIYLQHVLGGAAVIVLPPGVDSVDEALCRAKIHATVTHDASVTWPDTVGCQLANSAAEDGGFIALEFAAEADAQACCQRLRQENGL